MDVHLGPHFTPSQHCYYGQSHFNSLLSGPLEPTVFRELWGMFTLLWPSLCHLSFQEHVTVLVCPSFVYFVLPLAILLSNIWQLLSFLPIRTFSGWSPLLPGHPHPCPDASTIRSQLRPLPTLRLQTHHLRSHPRLHPPLCLLPW